jgi:hypothetical protein
MFHPVKFGEVEILLSSDGQACGEENSLNPAIRIPGVLDSNPVSSVFGDGAVVDGETKWSSMDQSIFFLFIF